MFKIKVIPATSLSEAKAREDAKGYFILATNDLDKEQFTPKDILETYKAQQSVE